MECEAPAAKGRGRRLVVNADDFGLSASVNHAVAQAHRNGILTTASLMVNEPGCAEAVEIARQNPRLGVGLHLSLLHGRSALSHDEIPGLADRAGRFTNSPVGAGMRYFFVTSLRPQLRREIRAQFEKFHRTGLKLDHVNGHLHLHLHPAILPMVLEEGARFNMTHVRLTVDALQLNLELAPGRLGYRFSHALIFSLLSARARSRFHRFGLRHTDRVFGLLQDGRVDERFITALIPRLPSGDSELYSHPSLHDFKHEYEALISGKVRSLVDEFRIELVRYQDL